MAIKLNFDGNDVDPCEQGTTFEFIFNITDDNDVSQLSDVVSAKMQVRKNYGGDLIIELSTSNNRIFFDSNLQCNLYVLPTDTRLLPPGSFIYDLEFTYSSGEIERIFEGEFHVTPEVTI